MLSAGYWIGDLSNFGILPVNFSWIFTLTQVSRIEDMRKQAIGILEFYSYRLQIVTELYKS